MVATEAGDLVVLAMGDRFEVLAVNTLRGQSFIASPVVVGGDIYLREPNPSVPHRRVVTRLHDLRLVAFDADLAHFSACYGPGYSSGVAATHSRESYLYAQFVRPLLLGRVQNSIVRSPDGPRQGSV
jgi:hypothetical protein